MKNWKIGTRIMAGFGGVIFLTLLLGGFACSRIGNVSRSSAEISNNSMPSIEQIMRLILQHILSGDKQEMASLDQLIQENRTKNAEALAKYEKDFVTTRHRDALADGLHPGAGQAGRRLHHPSRCEQSLLVRGSRAR